VSEPIEDKGPGTVLCPLGNLPDPGGKGFQVGARERFFVIRRGEAVYGYVNICPHQGVTLDWRPDTFLTYDKSLIQCSTHGAVFEIDTGLCVAGPCVRRRLAPVRVRVENGVVVLDE
jgi:nitrite reductase/ring-hydroxylating ferredoxin subunit